MKTRIYNLIILDESGSMDCMRKSTIDGCNETINTIRAAQKKFADHQEHFVSIYAFQSEGELPSRYLIKNVPALEVDHISKDDYCPYGMTPLYDAVGGTLTDLRHKMGREEKAIGSVTIITDGYENSSVHYSLQKVAKMIEGLKELGWNFNFIGANIDVESASAQLNIDNHMAFEQSEEGVGDMFACERNARMSYFSRVACELHEEDAKPVSFRERMKRASKNYFSKDEDEE